MAAFVLAVKVEYAAEVADAFAVSVPVAAQVQHPDRCEGHQTGTVTASATTSAPDLQMQLSINETMDTQGEKITVWVGPEEKIVCGLTKYTTSADVVQALLEEQQNVMCNSRKLLGELTEYCIVKEWKGFQCILPPSMKILQIWKKWGQEQVYLNFFLVKKALIQPCLIWTTNKYLNHHSPASAVTSFPLHKQKRIVRKVFRKLAKMKKGIENQEKQNVEKLLQIIASQDCTIIQQTNRIQELDTLIEEYERSLQLDKEDKNTQGCNSVEENDGLNRDPYNKVEINAGYKYPETSPREMYQDISPLANNRYQSMSVMVEKDVDMYMLNSIINATEESFQVSIKLHSLYMFIQKEILHRDSLLRRQKRKYKLLKHELKSLSTSEDQLSFHSLQSLQLHTMPFGVENIEGLENITADFSNIHMQSDTGSDTGISSTHSQDSDPPL
ncbi:ras association domain-containing protein 9 [Gastrophryne carolinensis]